MSADGDEDGGPGRREVAYRLFAAEFDDANLEYSESDEERAPNYVVTPTGARVNRLFVVGVLTEVEAVSDDVLRGRVVDPTGAFVCYAGQYQQDERAFLDRAEPPAFVAVTGKARTFQPEDSDRVFTSVRPESLSEVDAETRDRWTVDAAEQTIDRIDAMATAIALDAEGDRLERALLDRGVEAGLADGIVQALAHYETTPTYLAAVRDLALNAARHVSGELDEVPSLDATPDLQGDVRVTDLLAEPVEPIAEGDTVEETAASPETESAAASESTGSSETTGRADISETSDEPESELESDAAPVTSAAGSAGDGEATQASTAPTTDGPAEGDTVEDVEAEDAAGSEAAEAAESADGTDGPGDFDPGDFDLDEAEREEIEAEYGTEFQSGTDVDEPGEADIDTADPDDVADAGPADSDASAAGAEEPETAQTTESTATPASTDAGEDSTATPGDETTDEADGEADVDLTDAVVDAMSDLDEGEGADRDAVRERVADEYGVDPDAVDDAIQDALMDGRCYEPDDDVLKPI